jgi:hypothetical protein
MKRKVRALVEPVLPRHVFREALRLCEADDALEDSDVELDENPAVIATPFGNVMGTADALLEGGGTYTFGLVNLAALFQREGPMQEQIILNTDCIVQHS